MPELPENYENPETEQAEESSSVIEFDNGSSIKFDPRKAGTKILSSDFNDPGYSNVASFEELISRSANSTQIYYGLSVLTAVCHGEAVAAGWYTDLKTGERKELNIMERLMLIVTEIAEAAEGHRKDLMDDKLPHRKMIEVEFADTVIRLFDTAGYLGLDVAGAILEKMEYNRHREDHKIENRVKEGGKKL